MNMADLDRSLRLAARALLGKRAAPKRRSTTPLTTVGPASMLNVARLMPTGRLGVVAAAAGRRAAVSAVGGYGGPLMLWEAPYSLMCGLSPSNPVRIVLCAV